MEDSEERRAGTFRGDLAELKRTGANLLVVGAVPDDVHERVSRRLLAATDGNRRRILASSGVDTSPLLERLPAQAPRDPEHLRVVLREAPTPPGGATGTGDRPTVTRVESDGLGEFGAAIIGTITEVEGGTDLDPTELCLCLDSVGSLLDAYDRSCVLVALHLVTERVDGVDGLGHYHLSVDRNEKVVSTLVPLFDALVELRTASGRAQQRWHVRDGDSSGWFPLDPAG